MSEVLIEIDRARKSYLVGGEELVVLRDVCLRVGYGEYLAIMGPSGSGKSTLMNIVGCLDLPDAGSYRLDGTDVRTLSEDEQAEIRNRTIGFVFQSFNLIARTSAQENVELPLMYAGVSSSERRRRARAALEMVGIADRADHAPSELSGGQQQRVAIARAIVADPALILADEPTGALDSKTTQDVIEILSELNAEGRTVVMITHEDDVAAHAKRVIRLRDGEIVSDTASEAVPSAR